MKNSTKVIVTTLVITITAVLVMVIADINKTKSRVVVTETPNYHIELAGGFDLTDFLVGDNNKSNEIFPTKDGGWISSKQNTNGRSDLVKYTRTGEVQWSTNISSAIDQYVYDFVYPHEPERTNVRIDQKSSPSYGPIRHIVEALDGSGYFVQTTNYNIVTKVDTNGNILWQSQHYDQGAMYTFEKVCTYDGNTDADGKVKTYYWTNRYVGGVEEWYWQENSGYTDLNNIWIGADKYQIDAEHYYCGVKNDYYNYRSSYSGYLAPDTEGGVFFIINTYDSYPFKLSDGTMVKLGNTYSVSHYDAQGNFIGVYDLSKLINEGRRSYEARYGLTSNGEFRGSDLYHAYVGTYPNGDILFSAQNATDIVKVRFNKEQDKFELLSYNTPGWNSIKYAGSYYNNWDGILDFTLLKNGGYSLIMNTSTSGGSRYDYYNTAAQHFEGNTYYDSSDRESNTPGSSTPIQIYNANGTYDNIIIPYGSNTKYPEMFENNKQPDYIYYSTGNGSGAGFLVTEDGGAIAFLPIHSYSIYRNYPLNTQITLTNGDVITIDEEATFMIVKYNKDSQVEWVKQYKGITKYGSANTKIRISNDQKTIIAPYVVGAGAIDLDTGEDITALTGTGPRFLRFNVLFDRHETIIPDEPDPTEPTQTNQTVTRSTSAKKTKKKTTEQTVTEPVTEPVTEETTETTTTTTTTTSKRTTTQKEEVKGEETKKDPKMVIIIAISSLGGLFTVGFGFYFIPILFFPKKKVLVGISGNKDSAVAARLLLDKGYKVTGLFIGNGSNLQQSTYAKQICSKLNIDLYEQEIDETYKNKIAEGIINTPNADLEQIYTKYILVDMLKQVAKEQHIKHISCGIYAKKESGSIVSGVNNVFDESSKLALLTAEDIKKIILPLGDIDYQNVEKIANDNYINLSNAKQTAEDKIGVNNMPKTS